MKTNFYYSVIYNFLLDNYQFRDQNNFLGRIWRKVWDKSSKNFSGAVLTKIHGFKVKVNNGNSYPLFARLFKKYNNPLLQIANSAYELNKRELVIIDVGSAIGDTNLFLLKNLSNKIGSLYCIEGDADFFQYLEENKVNFPKSYLYNVMLSDSDDKKINSLIKTHLGTACAIGSEQVSTFSLDTLLFNDLGENVDILKIDVDGFDGKILKGSKKILSTFKPFIIFEWHPIMISKTGNSFFEHFEFLTQLGYNKFLWFNKYGEFSHFDFNIDFHNREKLVDLSLRNIYDYDWHYDIIAVHSDSNVDELEIAEMKNAKVANSRY